MTTELTVKQIRQDMLIAIRKYAGPVCASLAANYSERWTVESFVAEWDKTIGDLIAAAQRELAETAVIVAHDPNWRCPACDGGLLPLSERYMHEAWHAEQERDGAYRERAQLGALLAALFPAVLAPAPDVDEAGWQILYLTLPTGQASWHIHPRDAELYGHVEHVGSEDPRAQWDGHTTPEKYQRIADIAADATLLTHTDALELVEELGQQAYQAQDRLAFITEMCASAEQDGSEITAVRLRSWLAYTGCGGVITLAETEERPLGSAIPSAGREET